jgi:hypothetical protein
MRSMARDSVITKKIQRLIDYAISSLVALVGLRNSYQESSLA